MRTIRIFLTVLLIAVLTITAAWTQHEQHAGQQTTPAPSPPAMQPAQPQHGGATQPGTGGMMGGMMGDMPMMMCPMGGSMVVSGDSLYVMRGNELFRFHKDNLHLLASTTLPTMQVQGMQQTMGQMPQTGGMMSGPMMGGMAMMRPHMQEMMQRMQQMPSQQFDRMFMQNMMRHHAGAITMSTLARYKADHPELRQFARNVVDDQTRENRQFTSWLRQWYDASGMETLMPQDQQIAQRLEGMRGRDFEVEYMRAMIVHHTEAVNMAQIAAQRASHPELRLMASDMARDQSAEIEQLRGWLSAWYGLGS